jgi:hypothetical protein
MPSDFLHCDARYSQTVESRMATVKQGLDFDSSHQ